MYKESLIEITQDAACVIRNDAEDAIGFFTDNIQTCLIYIIKTESVTIAIHDSGQLCIEDLSAFIGNYGMVFSVAVVYGPDINQANIARLPKLLSSIGYNKKTSGYRSDWNIFSVAYEVKGGISILPNTAPKNVCRIPNKETVQTIVELNNNFIPLNSQSLPLDIQFSNGSYCNNSKLLFSIEEMLDVYAEQPQYADINLTFLRKGHAAGIFSLPNDFPQ